jgi:L-ascorbate metabolism protein UlaG (beta-lactamase superfamily)
MRVTKFEHAALRLEKDGAALVVDPGTFTRPVPAEGVVAVVLTHEHPDHWTPAQLDLLRAANLDVPIFGPEGVARAAEAYDVTVVHPGDELTVGPFSLRFFGGEHAEIHSSIPIVQNVGVLVDDRFYYPGDSFAVPDGALVDLLAAPIGAPWLKIGETMDFVLAVAPRRAFGTHDMTIAEHAIGMHRARLRWAVEQDGGALVELEPGDAVEV